MLDSDQTPNTQKISPMFALMGELWVFLWVCETPLCYSSPPIMWAVFCEYFIKQIVQKPCCISRSLEWCPSGNVYVIMCFVVRGVEAVAAAATSTASLAIAAHTFPESLSKVMVSAIRFRYNTVHWFLNTHKRQITAHRWSMTWKHFQHCWPFVRGIHRSPLDSPHNRPACYWHTLCC